MSKHFVIAETSVVTPGMQNFLQHIGAPDWNSDASTDAEYISEVAGRLCYKSFAVGLNPNVTRVREGNHDYLGNIIKQKHGSVFEHSTASVVFCDVSRIFTHEIVRHRAGMAYSQESQRFVRLDNFQVYIPNLTNVFEDIAGYVNTEDVPAVWAQDQQEKFISAVGQINTVTQGFMQDFIKSWELNNPSLPFHLKKQVTSAMRRFVAGGVNTNIMVTGNHRIWRHIIEARTSFGAEEEIAKVIGKLAEDFQTRYPAFYQDMVKTLDSAVDWPSYTFVYGKI